jgi:hypothetical protein
MPEPKLSVAEFSAKVKSKYPQYKDVDDSVLVSKMLDKYPVYSEQVDFDVKKKELSEASASQSLAEPSASAISAEVPAAFGEIPKFEGTKEAPKADVEFDAETAVKRATGDPLQTFKDLGTIVGGSIAEGIVSANTFVNRAVEAGLLGSSTDYFSSNSAKLLEPLQSKKNELKSAYVGPDSSGKGIVETFQENPSEGAKLLAFEALYQVPQMLALGAIGRSAMIAEGAVGAGLRTGAIISPRTQLVKSVSESVAPMVPLGLSSAGQAYLEAAEKNPEDNWIDTITNLAVGAYKGTSEIASELLFRTSVDDLIRGGFRKGIVSDIAKSTRPTLQAYKQLGRDAAVEGFQEGLEELAVEISSNSLDALIYGEDMLSKKNIYGMADAFILGSAIGSPITLLSKGPSAIGTAKDINKRRKISEEVNDLYDVHQDRATSASEKAVVKGQIINKLAELKQVENGLASFYEEFSEEDRDNVISLNQQLSMAQLIYPELQNEQSKESLQEEVKKLYSDKTKIEVKYDPNIKVYEYDTQKEAGVPSPVVEGEAPIEVQPIEGAGQETPEAGGVLQVPVEEGAEVTSPTAVTDVVSDFIDRRVSYITPSKESVEGFLYDEGAGKLVIEDDKGNKYDIGNVDDVGGISSADLGVSQAITEDFDISPEGNFVIRGQEYVNQYSNPDAAIQRDSDGNVVSVNLETTQGAKRAFRGPIAETIAYNIALAQKAETINEVESAAVELPTSTVIAAPFFNTTVASISEARNLRKTPEYKQQQRIINRQAKLTGVEVIKIDESIGGFENSKGEKIVEVSNVIQVRGDRANVDNFAAMLGAMSVETQEATIAADYVKSGSENHNADELTFVVSNIDGAIRALKTQGFYDFTINDSASTITVLDFSLGQDIDFQIKIGNLVAQFKLQKIKYEKEKRRALDSRYIGPETRKGIFGQLQGAPLQRGQAGSELRNEVSKAIRRNEEIISFLAEGKPTSEAVVEETVVDEDVPQQVTEQVTEESSSRDVREEILDKEQLSLKQRAVNTAKSFVWSDTQKQIRVFKERMSSQLSVEGREIKKFTKGLNKLLKKADVQTIDLVGNIFDGTLTPENQRILESKPNGSLIFGQANAMRNYIDSFSEDFVNSPEFHAMPEETVNTIIDNFGQYMRGSYRFWKDKNFKPSNVARRDAIVYEYEILRSKKINDIIEKEGFKENEAGEFFEQLHEETLKEATKAIDDYIADIEKIRNGSDFKKLGIVSPSGIKLPSEQFLRRKELPETIQNLLGKERDPIIRFIDTTIALSNIKYKGHMLYAISESLGGTQFIKNEVTDAEKSTGEYKEVKDKFSPLNGRFVHRDVYEAITNQNIYESDNIWMSGYLTTLQLARKSKVIYNLPTWRKNLTGGWYTMAANGVINPSIVRDIKRRAQLFANGETDAETEALIKIMGDNGIIGQDVNANLLGFTNAIYSRTLTGNDNDYTSYVDRARNLIKNFDSVVGQKYAAVDDYTKLVIFRSEIQSFAKKMYGKSYDSLTDAQKNKVHTEAAEFVKQNTPTFSRLPKWYASLAKLPAGDFLSFEFESLRSFSANIRNGQQDLMKGMNDKTLSKEQKAEYIKSGSRRLAGSAAIMGTRLAITSILASLALGDDDELEEDIKNNRPNWMEGHSIIPTKVSKEGIATAYDYSMEDPYGSFFDLATDPLSFPAYVVDLLQPNMGISFLTNLAENKDFYGRDITNSYDSKLTKGYKYGGHTLKSLIIPPFIASSYRDEQKRLETEADKYSPLDAVGRVASRAVIRDYEFNIPVQFYYFTDKFRTKKEQYSDLTGASRDNRLAELDEIKKMYKSITNIGIKKGNYKMIADANKNIKRALKPNEEAYVLYGYEIPEKK